MSNWTDTGARTYPRRYPTHGTLTPRPRPDWMDEGACKKRTDMFFPGEGALDKILAAKAICHGCPVESQCLAYALEWREEDGVWGGTSGEQRKAMSKAKRRAS